MSVFGGVSKGERNRIKVRVRAAMATHAQMEGRYLGGRPPYGYKLIDVGPHSNPAKAADGKRMHALALLDVADVALGCTTVQRWNEQDDWIWSEQPAHEPLIDPATFEQAQALRRARGGTGQRAPRRTLRPYALRVMLYCGLIGAYELLMRQVRYGAAGGGKSGRERRPRQLSAQGTSDSVPPRLRRHSSGTGRRGGGPGAGGSAGRELQRQAWHWALAQRAGNGGDGWSNAGWKSRQECRRSGCCRWHASLYTA
jgi:hypothetical protein